MATVLVSSIINRASTLIQDATNVRWPTSELLGWLNDGQREVVLIRPQASVVVQAVQLAAGTRQTLPANGVMLTDVIRNMGTDGNTPGNAVRVVSREVLDAQVATWHASTASATVKHYMYDPRNPKTYYVYPPQPASSQGYVEMVYSASPTDCTDPQVNPAATIQIDDIYANALLDYVLYRAYSKDAEYAQNANLAVAHYQSFANALGVKTQNEMGQNPNISVTPFNPNVPGGATV